MNTSIQAVDHTKHTTHAEDLRGNSNSAAAVAPPVYPSGQPPLFDAVSNGRPSAVQSSAARRSSDGSFTRFDTEKHGTSLEGMAPNDLIPLPADFELGPKDVICQRGKTAFDHNKHFRDLIDNYRQQYSQATSRVEKCVVISNVVDRIEEQGGFVRRVNGVWYKVGDHIAREKVGGHFREILHQKYKSASTSRKKRLREDTSHVCASKSDVQASKAKAGSNSTNSNKRQAVASPPVVPAVISVQMALDKSPPTKPPAETMPFWSREGLLPDHLGTYRPIPGPNTFVPTNAMAGLSHPRREQQNWLDSSSMMPRTSNGRDPPGRRFDEE